MEVFKAVEERRAIKAYDPEFKIPQEEVAKLLSAAIKAPTAFNIQHWRFVLAEDPELRKEIRAAAWNQAQITEASLLFVLCGDIKAWAKDPARYWRNAAQETQDVIVPMIKNLTRNFIR